MANPTTLQTLVTGANRGLGLALTRQLLATGHRVIAACRQPGRATELNHLTGDYPGHLRVLPLELASDASIAELAREAVLVAGPIDLLINNAGVLPSGERFGKLSAESLASSFRCNASAPLLLTQALSAQLADGATVANITSQLGSIANTTRFRTPSYAISKAAQNMATRLLTAELAPRGITVLALHPGWVRTDMGGSGAEIDADESAAGLLQVIADAGPAQSGSFLDWRGEQLPW
ncbi:MAG: SDR family oxidoreductase [Rhodanobacteraceae bacterium]|nr:SDR family oxidoreductase [Rhodanobacteraceae bacterium]HPF73583.1 SDR family oxidoreductase [Xanthomonadaceae bacterium]HRX99455.1 SDR family oxidoreductase [Xanthomonadaceae bacterium]